tara:strand:+ start:89 stop:235 length:147 start_codon:yes stop_codon:yes gene_type:complete
MDKTCIYSDEAITSFGTSGHTANRASEATMAYGIQCDDLKGKGGGGEI